MAKLRCRWNFMVKIRICLQKNREKTVKQELTISTISPIESRFLLVKHRHNGTPESACGLRVSNDEKSRINIPIYKPFDFHIQKRSARILIMLIQAGFVHFLIVIHPHNPGKIRFLEHLQHYHRYSGYFYWNHLSLPWLYRNWNKPPSVCRQFVSLPFP